MFSKPMFLGALAIASLFYIFSKDSKTQINSNIPVGITYYVDNINASPCLTCSVNLRSKQMMPGTSWVDAFSYLNDALAVAVSGDTIKVAQGTYFPDQGTGAINNDRNSSFVIPSGVILLGGYPTGGAAQSNPTMYKTILSGEINGDLSFNGNSYHVVVTIAVSSSTLIDGFCITGGNADNLGGDGYVKYGGGWFNRSSGGVESSPTISNCNFYANQTGQTNSNFGGGAFASYATEGNTNPRIINTIMQGNVGVKGGAIRTFSLGQDSACVLTLINCLITGNEATGNLTDLNADPGRGGAIYNDGVGTVLNMYNCVMSGNYCNSNRQGGSLYNANFGSIKPVANLTNCIIWNNVAGTGENNFYLNPGPGDSVRVSYSIIGPSNSLNPGTGSFKDVIANKIGVNPLFNLAPLAATAPTTSGDFHLQSGSPAIDMGLNSANTNPTDLDQNHRILGVSIDLGVYETPGPRCVVYSVLNTIFVDSAATGSNDGTSWANAFTDMQDALQAKRICGVDTIKVAKGTYYPATPPAPTYNMYTDCGDGLNNATIKAGNDSITIQILTNQIEYVKIWNSVWGLVTTPPLEMNGYLCDIPSSMHAVPNCDLGLIVSVNVPPGTYFVEFNYFPTSGGTDCLTPIVVNAAPLPDRTVSFDIPDSTVVLGGYGHGADSVNRNWKCNKTILCGDVDKDGIFTGNSYHVVTTYSVSPATTVDGFCITGGNANGTFDERYGAGWFNRGLEGDESSPTIKNCIISGNTTSTTSGNFHGGGMANYSDQGTTKPTLINTIISNNLANRGGGMYNYGGNGIYESSPTLINCIVSGNKALNLGGGMYNDGEDGLSKTKLINSVIAGNIANNGLAIASFADSGDSTTTITNSIIWNNGLIPFFTNTFGNPRIQYSIIQTPSSDYNDLGNNKIGTDPLFINSPLASAAPTATGDFHVTCFSPAIDMGDDAAYAELTDLDGLPRKSNTIDMGVYEFQAAECSSFTTNIAFVDSTATSGANNGTTWTDAFTCLQDALLAVKFCDNIDTIKVAEGTYFPGKPDTLIDECTGAMTFVPASRSDFFHLHDGITILGGYPSGGETNGPRDPHCNITILSGDIDHNGDSTGNTYNVVKTIDYDSCIVFDGFIIEHGNAVPIGEEGGAWWDGTITDSAKLIIRNTIFRYNFAVKGGGFYGEGFRELTISHSEFYNNEAVTGAAPGAGGGGAYAGVAISQMDTAFVRFENVLWHHNTAEYGGGFAGITMAIPGEVIDIVNNTFTLNTPDAYSNDNTLSIVRILNTIMWSNGTASITGTNVPMVINSLIESPFVGSPGTNNKTTDPLFIDPASNFRLSPGSPAFNMGDNSFSNEATDLDGLPRIAFGTVDIGAYEAIINCDTDTIYVNADGSVDPLPIDSMLGAALTDPACSLLVDGVLTTDPIPFDCDDRGENPLQIDLVKLKCNIPDTLYSCIKIVVVLDTFDKRLIAHDQVNVSLDEMCMAVITAHDVLVNFKGCNTDFEVTLAYPSGTNVNSPANKIDGSHLGYCMTFTVTDKLTGNKTWGKLCVEDKKGPELACQADTVTCFEIAQLPQGSYTVKDNCASSETKVLVVSEQFIDYGCEGLNLLNTVPQWDGNSSVTPFGVPNTSTYGQSFDITGSTTSIHSITIQILCITPNVTFRGHIYAWDGFKATGPSLFDGPMQMAASVANVFMPATINTAGLTLPAGSYVFFISTSEDVQPNIGCRVGRVDASAIPTGSFVFLNNATNTGEWTTLAWSQIGGDLAIEIKISPNIQGKVIRHLIATDPWGNTTECDKEYVIQKLELDSVVCPRDTGVDCSLEFITIKENKVSFKDPSRSGYPKIKTKNGLVSLWPNNAACKLTLSPPIDEWYPICGAGYKIRRTWRITDWCTGAEKLCVQWIEVVDKTAPVAANKIVAAVYSDPHDCGQFVNIDTLVVNDCSRVIQNYSISYFQEGIPKVIQGVLPAKHIWLPVGVDTVKVFLVDACKNTSKARILIPVIDNTPPTPICDEFTQVTVDPASCWASIAAKDLDNGSRDNCCDVLHYAAAYMDSITFWRNHWTTTLEAEVGKEEFWKDKDKYDALIEDWINCYVFSDTVNFDECGTNQVVMRVYEACGLPRLDPHVFPCSPHAWFCYNTYLYMGDFNYNWFDANGSKSCKYRPALTSLALAHSKYIAYEAKGYLKPKFVGAAQFEYCNPPYLSSKNVAANGDVNLHRDTYCPKRLYSDCMVNVLVDDKQAPVAYGLKDITIYCDGAPEWSKYKYCGDDADHYRSSTWPGELKDKKGVIHGYYGGSDFLGIHVNEDDHADPQACRESHGWAPIYCKDWLLLDSFDQAGHQDYASYFDKLLMFDKKTKQSADLKENEFSITDNCLLDKTSLKTSDGGTINGCGEGWISRTWTMKDKCGNEVTATQKIYVKHRSDFEVIFPVDKVVTCDFFNRTDTTTRGAGAPTISDDECEQIGVQYKDEVFTVEEGACYKIVRTWTMIDWCIYDPNQHNHQPDVIVNDTFRANTTNRSCVFRNIKDNGDGYMQYVQVIKVIDEIAPIFTCSDNTTCITAGCDATVNLPVSASDNCTNANDIRIRAEITKPDATVESRTNITAITGTFTEGVYKVKMVANDKCGNETTCNMTITVKDCKKPTPYCIDGLATVIMPNSGTVEIWAKDFNVASEDNCTAKDALRYSFGPDVTKPNRVITCTDIRNGREELLVVDIYVHDLADNKDLCKVSLKIQDNSSAEYPSGGCRDTTSALATITGKLATEEQEGVENARVEIRSSLSPSVNYMSKQDGSYTFKEMPMVGTYTLHALRDDEPMNGVSTLDLVAIQKHILGTEKLKSAYKMIAADVNNDKDISAIDLIELRKLILGVYEKLPGNTSWKFVPKSYVFNDINNPWSYPTQEVLTEMNDQMVKDFVGIKVGDVNASATPHSLMGTEVRSTETGLIFEVEDKIFRKGEAVKVEFKSPNFAGVSGFQGTMSMYNVPYTMYNVEAGALSMSEKNIGKRWINEGIITMSWNDKTGIDIESDKVLFTLTFKAEKDGKLSDVMRIGSQRTKAESYEGKGELGNLSIRFTKNGKEVSGTNTLYQNYPNPFDQRTVIGINLAVSTQGVMKITDITGRVIKSIDREWNKGYNEIWLDRREITATGILIYTFESKEFKSSKRMIILE